MKINYLNTEAELIQQIKKYHKQYDKVFFMTQNPILKQNAIIHQIIQEHNYYICSNSEQCKTLKEYEKIIEFLSNKHCNRNSAIISIGGGTVTDLCGFVASSYMRGITHIVIPTTLLGMVDAAIGGKTALNIGKIRNLIGTYKKPDDLIIYNKFLITLNQQEIINGYAEIIKYALIMDKKLFIKIENNIDQLLYDINLDLIQNIIKICINHKLEIVKQDQFDQGIRNILNFGHTVGHAIESYYNFKISHGKAVFHGMHIASYLSYKNNNITITEYNRIMKLIEKMNLNKLQKLDYNKIMDFITADKKNINNELNYILLKTIGSAYIEKNFNKKNIKNALKIL
ncbi:MAG: 3-dehydroquinate synthase [Candidatus Marinimicrobia bacterium]|nr:3-dehydroquinate synthase [Candidatus Neomarinimicrobiota bacterium]|tara:strand:- start:68116 stop:69141 length:1026 start_codon:yes stop_codon:yes gene_type:complete